MGALDYLEKLGSEKKRFSYALSSSICETTIDFVRHRWEPVQHIIKLAKYWDSNIKLDCYVSGRSYIIELVAIWSQESKDPSLGPKETPMPTVVLGFKRFLSAMKVSNRLYTG